MQWTEYFQKRRRISCKSKMTKYLRHIKVHHKLLKIVLVWTVKGRSTRQNSLNRRINQQIDCIGKLERPPSCHKTTLHCEDVNWSDLFKKTKQYIFLKSIYLKEICSFCFPYLCLLQFLRCFHFIYLLCLQEDTKQNWWMDEHVCNCNNKCEQER